MTEENQPQRPKLQMRSGQLIQNRPVKYLLKDKESGWLKTSLL